MGSDFKSKARNARWRLTAMGVAVVAAVAAGGALAVTSGIEASGGQTPGKASPTENKPNPSSNTASSDPAATKFTPTTAPRAKVLKPGTNKHGIGTGFEHSALGAHSAAVTYWQDLDILDDVVARKQLTAITSKDSVDSIDRGVSDVRKVREGSGLPPSGGAPDGLSISTTVKATLLRSLDRTGDVVQVWMVYDRYATTRDKGSDDNPLKDQVTDLIVKWEDGDWKITEETKYTSKKTGPRAYDPDSKWAFMDGWRVVAGA